MQYVVITIMPEIVFGPFEARDFLEDWIDAHPETRGRLAKGFPEVSRHIANEAVNGRLRDAVPDYCVHGFSQWTKRWFIETV